METTKYVTNHFKNIRFIYYALTSNIKHHSQYINLKKWHIILCIRLKVYQNTNDKV